MSVFIEAETDPYIAERMNMKEDYQSQFRSNANIRRPTRGHVLKEDSDAAGEEVYAQDGKAYTTYYSNFFVQTVQEQRSEKQQIVDTFGDTYIFFFGEAPRLVQVQGMLLNTADFNWRDEFWENYDRYFRGTKLVERGARLYLIYDEVIIEGYMVSASATESAENPWVMPFGFQMFVTGYTALSSIGNPVIPGYDEYGTYKKDAGGEGYFDSATNKWTNTLSAGLNMASANLSASFSAGPFSVGVSLGASAAPTARPAPVQAAGAGKFLTDVLREGLANTADPATSDYTQLVSTAIGEGNRIDFKPNPRTGEGRFINNIDEFVQSSLKPKVKKPELRGDDEWGRASFSIDFGISASVSGGGLSITADLGGSDLKSSRDRRAGAARPQRDTPFGMTVQAGVLL